jgi:hypothetical protein
MRTLVRVLGALVLLLLFLAPIPAQAQAASAPAFVVGPNKIYAHATADSLTVWMNTLLEDGGAAPYYLTGAPASTTGIAMDPVANTAFTARIPLNPGLTQSLVLDGTVNVQAYIGGGAASAGVATIGTSLAVDGTVVGSAAAKNHIITGEPQAGTTYDPISWTFPVANVAVPAGATLEWIVSGTVLVGNNVYLAAHVARGSSYIEIPVASLAAGGPGGNGTDADADGLNDTWEQEQFGNTTEQNATGDPDADGLNNSAEFEHGTNATNPDTDGDGVQDGDEVEAGTDPLDPTDPATGEEGEGNGTDDNGTIGEDPDGETGGEEEETGGEGNGTVGAEEDGRLQEYLDSIRGDTGYAGASAGGLLGVVVLSLIGIAGRWGL